MALKLESVSAGYGRSTVIHGVDLQVVAPSIVSVVGPNGAGKTTLLKTVCGLISHKTGGIELFHEGVDRLSVSDRASRGLILCPEGRQLFSSLTVLENLHLGATAIGRRADRDTLTRILDLFPVLKDRLRQKAGTMSGGEQQMVAVGRALMARPRVLCIDEPTLGLALPVIETLASTLINLRAQGLTVVFAEQDVQLAVAISDVVHVMGEGKISGRYEDRDLRKGGGLPSFFDEALREAGLADT